MNERRKRSFKCLNPSTRTFCKQTTLLFTEDADHKRFASLFVCFCAPTYCLLQYNVSEWGGTFGNHLRVLAYGCPLHPTNVKLVVFLMTTSFDVVLVASVGSSCGV